MNYVHLISIKESTINSLPQKAVILLHNRTKVFQKKEKYPSFNYELAM